MSRVETKALFARVNGKPLKWYERGGGNDGIVVDAFVLANMVNGVVIKILDPEELKAKGFVGDLPIDDPKFCLCYTKFTTTGGYDNAPDIQREDAVKFAKGLEAIDSETPSCFEDAYGSLPPGGGRPTCPMY